MGVNFRVGSTVELKVGQRWVKNGVGRTIVSLEVISGEPIVRFRTTSGLSEWSSEEQFQRWVLRGVPATDLSELR